MNPDTVYEAFRTTCDEFGSHPFLHIPDISAPYNAGDIDSSYEEALTEIDTLAKIYKSAGYSVNIRVGLFLENRIEFFYHWLALNKLGCSVIPLHPDMQSGEISYFLEHGEAALVVSLPHKKKELEDICAKIENNPPVKSTHEFTDLPLTNIHSVNSALPSGSTECALLYTSGSTGKPKGCILDNNYFLYAGYWYNSIGGLMELKRGQERLLTPLPLNHMNAMACSSMAMIMSGGCIIQLDRFHPKTWWQSVKSSRATILHYLGVLPAILLEQPESADDDFSRQIKFGFGAGVNPKHHEIFEKRFGFPLLEAWAMTESGAGGSIIANHEPRYIGTCCFGKPKSWLEHQLVDEKKQVVNLGEPGELRVRTTGDNPARGFFSGYFKNPEATQEIWQDGWLNTGDVVREDENGYLYFVDRRKNVIRRSGENIASLEVEAGLVGAPGVLEALVTAVPDEIRGEEVAVCVVPKTKLDTDDQTAQGIVNYALKTMAYFKAPGYVIFCEALPRTSSNKPKRAEVKSLAKEYLAKGEFFDTRHLKKRAQN